MTDDIVVVDLFAGAGGMSTGIAQACRDLGRTLGEDVRLIAVNHDETAIATHEENHPWAEHYHAKVEELHPPDVVEPGTVDLLAGGPSCTHHSRARGGKPVKEQLRASPWHVLHWVQMLRPEQLLIENVADLRTWGPVVDGEPVNDGSIYEQWIATLQSLGYAIIQDDDGEFGVVVRAADYGDPTTRRRLFVIGSRDGRPTAPPATHSDDPDDDLADWAPASEVIDWSDRGESMFTRSRPLSSTTMERIATGIRDFCDDRLAPYAAALESMTREDVTALQEDVVDAGSVETALEQRDEPFLVRGEVAVPEDAEAGGDVPMVMGQHGGAMPRDATTEPLPTVAKSGAIHFMEAQAFVLPRNGRSRGTHSNPAYLPDEEPFHTVTAKNHDGRLVTPFLVQYNGEPEYSAQSVDEPLPTLTQKARYGLAHPEAYPWGLDVRYRMLDPPETKLAQGFPPDYELVGSTKTALRKQIGNAVPVNLSCALAKHLLASTDPSLSTYGGGLREDPDAEVPEYSEVASDD